MNYRQLGTSDLQVSEISYGCMSLGEEEKENTRLLHAAFDKGINFFDTADLYQQGRNEEFVGKALKDRRDKVIIATKVGNQLRPDGSGWDWNPSKEYIKKAVHDSLRRLQTDHIDLYQLHGGTIDDPIDETIAAFEELKEEGLIRYYGISSIRPNVIRTYLDRSNISSIMMQYSLLDRRPEEVCLDWIEEKEVSVIVRGGVAKGLLAGKPPEEYLNLPHNVVQEVQKILQDHSGEDHTMAQLALRYCLASPAVATVACGVSKLRQLEENVGTMDTPSLAPDTLASLRKEVPVYKYQKHR